MTPEERKQDYEATCAALKEAFASHPATDVSLEEYRARCLAVQDEQRLLAA
jgi:hypothetical protein